MMSIMGKFLENYQIPIEYYDFYYSPTINLNENGPFYFLSGFSAKLIHTTLKNSGFLLTIFLNKASLVVGNKQNEDTQKYLKRHQRMTHYFFTHIIGNKLGLHKSLIDFNMRTKYPIDFYPKTYVLPGQYEQFKKDFSSSIYWIQKPFSGSCGRGINLINKIGEKTEQFNSIVQEYIPNPLLIKGYKFDLRFYVAVPSLDPLRIYNYENGLVRLATEKYFEHFDDINALSAHLTNFSINKENQDYHATDDINDDGKGSKWSHAPFWPFLQSLGYDIDDIKKQIDDAVSIVLISAKDTLIKQTNHRSSFELYGFDVLLTVDGKIHILEVNISPALGTSSNLDRYIKAPLVKDFFNLGLIPKHTDVCDKIENAFYDPNLTEIADLFAIFEYEISETRKGNFRTIYPTIERVKQLGNFMKEKGHFDKILEDWISCTDEMKEEYLKSKIPALKSYLGDLVDYPDDYCLLL